MDNIAKLQNHVKCFSVCHGLLLKDNLFCHAKLGKNHYPADIEIQTHFKYI